MLLYLVCGTRPNFMKIAPLIHAIREFNRQNHGLLRFEYRLIHTGQHYDKKMSDIFLNP